MGNTRKTSERDTPDTVSGSFIENVSVYCGGVDRNHQPSGNLNLPKGTETRTSDIQERRNSFFTY